MTKQLVKYFLKLSFYIFTYTILAFKPCFVSVVSFVPKNICAKNEIYKTAKTNRTDLVFF